MRLSLWITLLLAIATGCSSGSSSDRLAAPTESSNEVAGVLADIDGDGHLDLLRVSTETQPVSILQAHFGDGQGRFLDNTPNLTSTTLGPAASRAILARVAKGRKTARGVELLRVLENDETQLYFVIFG